MATSEGNSPPGPNNLAFVESLYEDYARDPDSVPADWRRYFAGLSNGELRFPKPRFGPSCQPSSLFNPPVAAREPAGRAPLADRQSASLQDRLYLLIRLYRVRGHRIAQFDPLGLPKETRVMLLAPLVPEVRRAPS